jgi:hypothetical protein
MVVPAALPSGGLACPPPPIDEAPELPPALAPEAVEPAVSFESELEELGASAELHAVRNASVET